MSNEIPDGQISGPSLGHLSPQGVPMDAFLRAELDRRKEVANWETHTPAQVFAVLWEMARNGKLDRAVVAHLAEAFEVHVGATVDDGPVYRRS